MSDLVEPGVAPDPAPAEPVVSDDEPNWTGARVFLVALLCGLCGLFSAVIGMVYLNRNHPELLGNGLGGVPPSASLRAYVEVDPDARIDGPIKARFILVNHSAQTIAVADRGEPATGRRDEYDVHATDEQGQVLPDPIERNFNPDTEASDPPDFIEIPPGGAHSWPIDLRRFIDFSKPGTYQLKLGRVPFMDRVRVEAPVVPLKIAAGGG